MAVRQIRANYRSVTGLVAADQTARSTAYESTLERDFIKHLLFNKNVLEHEEQPLTLDSQTLVKSGAIHLTCSSTTAKTR